MDNYMADNAGSMEQETYYSPEDGAAAVEETEPNAFPAGETGELEAAEEPEVATPPDDTENPPAAADNSGDVTRTQEFSRRLNEMTQRRMDEFIASQGYVNPYTSEPIRTQEEYNRYRQMYEAQQRGQDPVLAAQVAELRNQLTTFQLRDQDAQFQQDPERGEIYRQIRPEVLALVEYCRTHGSPQVDIKAAYNTVLAQRLPQILGMAKTSSQQETVRKLAANAGATPGPLSAGGENPSMDFARMSDKDFEALVARAERGELRKS